MKISDIFPLEAREAVARMRFNQVIGGVRVDDAGCCPMGELTHHTSIWSKIHDWRRAEWKPVMDQPSTVVWFLLDSGKGPQPEDDWASEEAYAAALDAWDDAVTVVIAEFCEGWDTGKITPKSLPKWLGVS